MSNTVTIPNNRPHVRGFGFDGNALALVGQCKRAARAAGWTRDELDEFQKEALSGDYDHVIQTCMRYFETSPSAVDDEDIEDYRCFTCGVALGSDEYDKFHGRCEDCAEEYNS